MSARLVNLALFALAPALAMTGLLAWLVPELGALLLVAHRAAGAALLVTLAWKVGIARRSIDVRVATGRAGTIFIGAVASVFLFIVMGVGLAWTLGVVSFDRPLSYSLLNVHVAFGIALVPLVVGHAAQRWDRLRAPLGRRDLLRLAAAGAAGVVLASALDRVDPSRRATGSRDARSFSGNEFPTTIWLLDSVPRIDIAEWRLRITGAVVSESASSYEGLLGAPAVEQDAVLDCTGGWASEQRWRGMPLVYAVRPRAGASRMRFVSVTGHSATFDVSEIERLMLATHVGGDPLTPAHGYPVRLVAPGHRGFAWVKWLTRIDVF